MRSRENSFAFRVTQSVNGEEFCWLVEQCRSISFHIFLLIFPFHLTGLWNFFCLTFVCRIGAFLGFWSVTGVHPALDWSLTDDLLRHADTIVMITWTLRPTYLQIRILAVQFGRHQQGPLRRFGRGCALRGQGRGLHLPRLQTRHHHRAVTGEKII